MFRSAFARFSRALLGLCFVALCIKFLLEGIVFPQGSPIDEQKLAINGLKNEVTRYAMVRGATEDYIDLQKRVTVLENVLPQIHPNVIFLMEKVKAELAGSSTRRPDAFTTRRKVVPDNDEHDWGVTARSSVGTTVSRPKNPSLSPPSKKNKQITWRDDMRCGSSSPLPDGSPAECDKNGKFPCCGPSGWCGISREHCSCDGCHDYRGTKTIPIVDEGYNQNVAKTIALVVPFRDRIVHLERFRDRIQSHAEAWNKKGVKHEWVVFVVEQFDTALFNRGYLFNVGFTIATDYEVKTGRPFDCIVMHDIDILPLPVVDYGWCKWPNQLAGEIECWQWSVPYPDNVGGVVSLSPAHWRTINGFSNEYEGWGGEDDDLYYRLKQHSLLKGGCHKWCARGKLPTVPMVFRPSLGTGRFTCLHDGDHTPRQRASDSTPVWNRLNAMRSNSDRWKKDGISTININEVGKRSESGFCSEKPCTSPHDDASKLRVFREIWIRTSQHRIRHPRVRLSLESCPGETRLLRDLPLTLQQLRQLFKDAFAGSRCKTHNLGLNFVAISVELGQAVMVGIDAAVISPDGSLPPILLPGETAKPTIKPGSQFLVQSERLGRWLRNLPTANDGLLILLSGDASVWRTRLAASNQILPILSPACVSSAAIGSTKKIRVTPGTKWCGDAGWTHQETFTVLRSGKSVREEDRLPICISYNPKNHRFRFENSERGCVGYHSQSETTWAHVATINTLKSASGAIFCVGFTLKGADTFWTLKRKSRCDGEGLRHSFSFKEISRTYTSPFVSACFLVVEDATVPRSATLSRNWTLRRFEAGSRCTTNSTGWRVEQTFKLLSTPRSGSGFRMCAAEGTHSGDSTKLSRSEATPNMWRVFHDESCIKRTLITSANANRKKEHWTISGEPIVHVPPDASGPKFCLCDLMSLAANASEGDSRIGRAVSPTFTWIEGDCISSGVTNILCFRMLTGMDMFRYSYLVDEAV
eukprot:TRINITY_DN33703_c0_g1_i1.p1 TRINITY_DN33703_c0_g1~~TRINITY_DN33703_c0_g1_i1.p1  ORF type:complete len:981 (+),score=86.68 TRINITY_DN33703_c0_g1_i1:111-3053(+)